MLTIKRRKEPEVVLVLPYRCYVFSVNFRRFDNTAKDAD